MDDYYKILGVSRDASDDDIKKAFRKLAHQYHPDKSGGDEKKFKEINEAYQVLSNKEKRAQYDRFGKNFSQQGGGFQGGPFGGFSQAGWNGDFGNMGFDFSGENLDDILGAFFGGGMRGGRTQRNSSRGNDIQVALEITLEEAYFGVTKDISFNTIIQCHTCKGTGAEGSHELIECTTCKGAGKIKEQKSSFFGTFVQTRECSACSGTGKVPKKPCTTCKGEGRVKGTQNVSVEIKEGIKHGETIKTSGKGEAGLRGATAGDLFASIRIKKHSVFQVDGDNLIMEKTISIGDIIAQKPIEINHANKKVFSVDIPHNFNVREPLVVEGEGMPRSGGLRSKRGDLIIVLNVKTPKKMSAKTKKLAEELAQELEKER